MKVNPIVISEVAESLSFVMEVSRLDAAQSLRQMRHKVLEVKRFQSDGYPIRHYILFVAGVRMELRSMTVPSLATH